MTTTRVASLHRLLALIEGHAHVAGTSAIVADSLLAQIGRTQEVIHGGALRSSDTGPRGFQGDEPLDVQDDFEVDLYAVVTTPGRDGAAARARCGELLEAIVDTVRVHKTLNRGEDPHPDLAGVLGAWPTRLFGPDSHPAQEGYMAIGRCVVVVQSRRMET